MKTYLVVLASVLLIAGIVGVVYGAESTQSVTASVTVTGAVSIAVDDTTLNFGSVQPGGPYNPDTNPINITIDANKDYSVTTKADSAVFTGGDGDLAASNLEWKNATNIDWTDYTTSEAAIGSGSAGSDMTHSLSHQLTIPENQKAAAYSLPITLKVAA